MNSCNVMRMEEFAVDVSLKHALIFTDVVYLVRLREILIKYESLILRIFIYFWIQSRINRSIRREIST